MKRLLVLSLSLVVAAAACSPPGAAEPPSSSTTRPQADTPAPRLVVLLVIDQLPAWAFAAKRPAFTGGFARLLREGAWHTGDYPTPATLTAVGHATIGSGQPPARSGIISNEWWDRDAQRQITSVEDGAAKSARRLRVPALGDAVAAARTGAKAVAVSLKDRGAILPLGRAGTSIWYDKAQVAWVSTRAPVWLATYNRTHPIEDRLDEVWTPLDPARLRALSGTTDAQPGEVGEKGFDPTFPHAPRATSDPPEALFATPLGNQLVFEAATAAIAGERLGVDEVPDLLVVSLSAYDLIAHGWGHESWESWDAALRLDHQLDQFLAQLDRSIGVGSWAMVVTSDHGAAPLPERSGGHRLRYEDIAEVANRGASAVLGPGAWIAHAKFPNVYLTAAARAKPAAARAQAVDAMVGALRALPGLARVEPTAAYAGACETRGAADRALCEMIDPERSGEIVYLPAYGWVLDARADRLATGHGSFNPYDRDVPLILLPFGRTTHAPAAAPTSTRSMATVSTLVAGWLGVVPPSELARSTRVP